MNEKKTFELGERRKVSLQVWLNDVPEFVVENSSYTLTQGDNVEAEGGCDVTPANKGFNITAEIQPQNRGDYVLQYTFNIGSEIIKRSVKVWVK